ncbi:hypothetical protein KJ660_02570 [Candidatus Micrarchaeota archaeon]|nr:hypothetical protein [Candidatus Micrarchaeota archaeon]
MIEEKGAVSAAKWYAKTRAINFAAILVFMIATIPFYAVTGNIIIGGIIGIVIAAEFIYWANKKFVPEWKSRMTPGTRKKSNILVILFFVVAIGSVIIAPNIAEALNVHPDSEQFNFYWLGTQVLTGIIFLAFAYFRFVKKQQ